MMNEILPLTTKADRELALARLIDDELSAAQERELLKHLDTHPEHWRPCALGFLEERALRRGARGWVKAQDTSESSLPLASPMSDAVVSPKALAPPVAPGERVPAVLPRNGTAVSRTLRKQRTWLDYATIAAALLIAFTGGLIVQQYQARPIPMNVPVAKETPLPAPSSVGAEQPSSLLAKTDAPSNLRLQYVNHEGEPSPKEIDVPLIPVNNVDDSMLSSWEQAARQNVIPQETQRWLEQEGQVVRQQNLWLTVELPNGQQALVPVQRIQVQPRHLLAQ
jgi:hypothetical protein